MTATETWNGIDERASAATLGDVMVVDDQPANLKLMEEMLRREGYNVRSFPRGRLALNSASQQIPDLILLDINMPEMDGIEVCQRLKADKKLSSIPVIFLSAMNETEDKVKAFRVGGVDYITKPFQIEEVQARVETHLDLQRARRAERDLLENTLSGAIRTLADLIHQTGPALASRSDSIRSIVVHLAKALDLEDAWQYELAATLCLIGCVILPAETFERAYGRAYKAREEEMFQAHPENGARLLAKIPRLEIVAEMIQRQQTVVTDRLASNPAATGACLLRVAVELDRYMFKGFSFEASIDQLKASRCIHRDILEALAKYTPPAGEFEVKALKVHELCVSMIAENDVVTRDGSFMILGKGTVLNATAIEKIRNFDKTRGISQPVYVRVPAALARQ